MQHRKRQRYLMRRERQRERHILYALQNLVQYTGQVQTACKVINDVLPPLKESLAWQMVSLQALAVAAKYQGTFAG